MRLHVILLLRFSFVAFFLLLKFQFIKLLSLTKGKYCTWETKIANFMTKAHNFTQTGDKYHGLMMPILEYALFGIASFGKRII